jgi:hypothetical protein
MKLWLAAALALTSFSGTTLLFAQSAYSLTYAAVDPGTRNVACDRDAQSVECARDTAIQECGPTGADGTCDLYAKYINPLIWFLSAVVGLAVTIGLIINGIKYSAAGGDPSQVANAKKGIKNAIVVLLAYLFLLSIMNWLVPGGIR